MRIVGRLYLLGNIQQADIGFGISLLSSGDNPQIALKECLEIVGSQVLHIGIIPLSVNFSQGFDDFFLVERDLGLEELTLQKEEVARARWAELPEILDMVDRGEFIDYPKSFLAFLFDMRGTFGFCTK